MTYSVASLGPEYRALYKTLQTSQQMATSATDAAQKIEAWRQKSAFYDLLEQQTGFPWFWIGCVHYLESSHKLTRHLHNGDPLTARTVHVPAGRPKAAPADPKGYTFAESAADALSMKKRLVPGTRVWSLSRLMFAWEAYNGFGYRKQQLKHPTKIVRTSYLWAGTNHQGQGRYVADGKFDINAKPSRPGAMAILDRLCDLGLLDREKLADRGYKVP